MTDEEATLSDPQRPNVVESVRDQDRVRQRFDSELLTLPEATPGEHLRNPPHFALTQSEVPDFSSWVESGHGIQGLRGSHNLPNAERAQLVSTYYGMISLMDKYIGVIVDKLGELNLAENTILVFTTDHGHFFGQHGLQAKGPFHYEDLLRIPFIARMPETIPGGRVTSAIQSHVDIAPTFLEFAGIEIPRTMTGVSQKGLWAGSEQQPRTHAICEFHHEATTVNLRTYVDHRYKITVYQGREYGELFDLEKDPGEIFNLWNVPEHAELKRDLLLRYIWAELGKEPMWMPRIALA